MRTEFYFNGNKPLRSTKRIGHVNIHDDGESGELRGVPVAVAVGKLAMLLFLQVLKVMFQTEFQDVSGGL